MGVSRGLPSSPLAGSLRPPLHCLLSRPGGASDPHPEAQEGRESRVLITLPRGQKSIASQGRDSLSGSTWERLRFAGGAHALLGTPSSSGTRLWS